ncbi:hypothetical protein HAALTHF_37340n [Vreelandella aquamarina]|nr:hypothetical protein HAALTHF_37340n [Halomonas axialensis]
MRHAKYAPLSTFTLVETTGIAWGWKLIKDSLRKQATVPQCEAPAGLFHTYDGEPIARHEKIALAKNLLTLLGTPRRRCWCWWATTPKAKTTRITPG